MRKVINPCMCDVYGRKYNAFVKIEYSYDGQLSMSGVIGPMKNGNCRGSAGQCQDEIRKGEPKAPWTDEMLQKLCDIWDEWHLNDMRPYCQHQKELGWREQANEVLTLLHYRMTNAAHKAKRDAEHAAVAALQKGETFTPTDEQTFFASLPYSLDIYEEPNEIIASHYEPKKALYHGDCGATEFKTRGWVRYDKCEKGLLCKPCPVCGYKYGTAWQKEDVPQEVIDWLFNLPDTEIRPAWV